jgi:hypothetical protein
MSSRRARPSVSSGFRACPPTGRAPALSAGRFLADVVGGLASGVLWLAVLAVLVVLLLVWML